MSKTLNSNIGYKGGSPRIQHEVLKAQPKVYGESDINEYISKIKKHYMVHNLSFKDLIYIDNYLTSIKTNTNYTGKKNESKLAKHFIFTIETLYTDGKINSSYIGLVISKLVEIINNVSPPKKEVKVLKTEKVTNTINNYDGSITNITREKTVKKPQDISISQNNLNSILTLIKNYYYNDTVTKDEINNLNNYFKTLNGEDILKNKLNKYLIKVNLLVENAFTDGRMSQSTLLSLINDIQTILDSDKPIIKRKKLVVKNKLSTLSPYYNK